MAPNQPARAKPRATFDDLLQLPPHVIGEIIDGDLYVSPRPATPHARASSILGGDLVPPFDRPPGGDGLGGWWILDEPELHLGADVLVPDLAGWRRERMPKLPDLPAIETVPDWVCEILSPATARLDRVKKMPLYGRVEVAHLWLIDPMQKTLEVFRRENGRWVVVANHGGDEIVRAEPFDAIELALERWWLEE